MTGTWLIVAAPIVFLVFWILFGERLIRWYIYRPEDPLREARSAVERARDSVGYAEREEAKIRWKLDRLPASLTGFTALPRSGITCRQMACLPG